MGYLLMENTMRIIKRGFIPENYVFQATCGHCKTEVEFEANEAKRTNDQREGDFLTVKCPLCGRDIHVDCKR